MKHGKTLTELATELERQRDAKADYIADTRDMRMNAWGDREATPTLEVENAGTFGITDTAHTQIAQRTNIPTKYYNRMRSSNPQLLAMNVNAWFNEEPKRRMVRTLDGNARALLSDRYQRIDNDHIAEVALPVLLEDAGIKVASCEVTESKLYIKAVNERVRQDVKVGDTVEAGVLITNSEIGAGAVSITPLVHRLVCLNGMTVNDAKYRRNHVGRQADTSERVYEMLSDEALRADDQAILLKVRDVIRASLDEARFAQTVQQMRDATSGERMMDPAGAVERLGKREGLLESEKPSILRHLTEGGDLSKYGLLNAVTRAAQDVDSYDRSTELEELGGKVLNLSNTEWRELVAA